MSRTDSNDLPFFERPDLSPFLVHLTKNSKKEDSYSGFDNLVSILKTGEVFGSTKKKGHIKGGSPASCFMDVPLNCLKYVLNEQNTDPHHPRYEPYGVVISKKYAYKNGCRPVLYLSNSEIGSLAIPESELWRVVRLESVDGTGINWLHEREWRTKGSFQMPNKVRAVLVKDTRDAKRLQKLINKEQDEFASIPASIIPLTVLCQGLPYLSS